MKPVFVFLFLLFSTILPAQQLDIDSLGKVAILHAAHHNIKALRPTYKQMGNQIPHFIKLYCDIAIASSEGRHERVIECIDSLKQWYPKKLQTNTLLSFAELKAEGLRQLGRYDELKTHCEKEIKYFTRRRFKASRLKELYFYQNKAKRLLGNDVRSQILQLADLKAVFELDSLLALHADQLDKFARLRSDIVLSHAFRHYEEWGNDAVTLVREYADSLDTKELTYGIEAYANLLVNEGKWEALQTWMDEVETIERSHSADVEYYSLLAQSFANESASDIVFPETDDVIPITYEWPLFIKAHLNGKIITDCFLETEQAHTLISTKIARACGARILPDTISIASSNGIVDVCPTLIKEFKIGNIKYTNLLVYTVLESNETIMPFETSLGTNEITRLGKISFLPEKMIIHQHEPQKSENEVRSNLYMAEQNGLRIQAYYNGTRQPLGLDLGYPHNVLNRVCFAQSQHSSSPVKIATAAGDFSINTPVYIEEKIAKCSGILGTTFLRGYFNVTLDFDRMVLEVDERTTYRPTRGKFGHTTDKFYLQRNRNALTSCHLIEKDEADFLDLLLHIGKNDPKAVVAISQQLRQQQSPFYDAYTEAEGLFFAEKYGEAIQTLKNVLDNQLPFVQLSPSESKVLASILRSYELFADCQPVKITAAQPDAHLEKTEEGWIEVRINGKKTKATAHLFDTYTEISGKYAKKMKVNILGTANGITHGIIPSLEIGGIKMENVHCVVNNKPDEAKAQLPHKGKGIRIGWDVLRHFKQMAYSENEIFFSLKKAETNKKRVPLYRLKDWIIQTESAEGYPTYQLTQKQNEATLPKDIQIGEYQCAKADFSTTRQELKHGYAGRVSMNYLLKKAKVVSFDLEKMEMF